MKRAFSYANTNSPEISKMRVPSDNRKTKEFRMKKFILPLVAIAALSFGLQAQEHKESKIIRDKTLLVDPVDSTAKQTKADTTIVRMGKKDVKVIDHEGGTEIIWGKDKRHKHDPNKFDGHWEGLELGFNSFAKTDYSNYNNAEFMSLNQGKSLELDFNFYELNIGLSKSYVGLVSGMGLSFNDYRFDNPYTLEKGTTMVVARPLNYDNLSKTKLSVSYLKVPLLLEFQIPVNNNEGRLYINGGIIGGVKIGSHTKVKHGDTKDKDRSSLYINSFKYEATARIGYKGMALFANYSLNTLFQSGKGPKLTPFTVGISFTD